MCDYESVCKFCQYALYSINATIHIVEEQSEQENTRLYYKAAITTGETCILQPTDNAIAHIIFKIISLENMIMEYLKTFFPSIKSSRVFSVVNVWMFSVRYLRSALSLSGFQSGIFCAVFTHLNQADQHCL